MTTGGPDGRPAVTPPSATIMSRFTEKQQVSIARQIDRAIEGRKTRTDQPTWYTIQQGLTAGDAAERERWADINLVQFRGELSDEDFAALVELQAMVRTNDGGSEARRLPTISRVANHALRATGINPTSGSDSAATQAATFYRAVQNELSAFESSKGRPATAADAQDIVDRLATTAVNGGWLEASDQESSWTEASDIPSTHGAFHEDGVLLAEAEPPAQPEQRQPMRIGLAPDFETFRRQMEEHRQRDAAERASAGAGGAPATEPDPGSPEYQAADAQARHQIAVEQAAEDSGGQGGGAPATEPPPGGPEYRADEEEGARKLDGSAWDNLGFFGQLGITFKRFGAESKKSGAALAIDSKVRRHEKVLDLQRKAREAPDSLNVTEKRYLLRNRNVASDLAGAVARLIDAQGRLDKLPSSDPLRRLSEASTVAEVGQLLRDHPGEIAKAIGVESLPALTVGLIATAALGPIGGAIALTGTSGLEGYATGLVGALMREGVNISNADELTLALQNKTLMERIRKDATTDGAIAAGVNALTMRVWFRTRRPKRAPLSLAMKVPPIKSFLNWPYFTNFA